MNDFFISLERTIAFVKDVTGASLGPACQTLISICESGEVRAQWTDHHSGTVPAVPKQDWSGADIDWRTFRVRKADGRFMRGVDFSGLDLNAWAASLELAAAPIDLPIETMREPTPCHGRRRLTKQSAVEWVRSYISATQNPSMPGIDAQAKADGIIGGRDIYRNEYKKQMAAIGIATTQGRRPNHPRD